MITYTKKPMKISNGLAIWIPKDIVDSLDIDENSLLEIQLKVKRIKKERCK